MQGGPDEEGERGCGGGRGRRGSWQRRDVLRPWVGHEVRSCAGVERLTSGEGCGKASREGAWARRPPPPRLAPMCPRIHWSAFLNIVQQTMESEREENVSIPQDKAVCLEGGEASEPKGPYRLRRFMTKWLTSPPRP